MSRTIKTVVMFLAANALIVAAFLVVGLLTAVASRSTDPILVFLEIGTIVAVGADVIAFLGFCFMKLHDWFEA